MHMQGWEWLARHSMEQVRRAPIKIMAWFHRVFNFQLTLPSQNSFYEKMFPLDAHGIVYWICVQGVAGRHNLGAGQHLQPELLRQLRYRNPLPIAWYHLS